MTDPLAFFKETYGNLPDWIEKMHQYSPEALKYYTELRLSILKDGALSRKEKELILVGINAARRYEKSMLLHTRGAMDAGAELIELAEILSVCILSRGLPAWLVGSKALEYAAESMKKNNRKIDYDQRSFINAGFQDVQECLEYYQEILGEIPEWVHHLASFRPDVLIHYSNLRRSNLSDGRVSRKLKELVLVGINVAERYSEGVRIHTDGARSCGATDQELAECYLTALLTAGIPAWFEGSAFLP